MQSVLKNIQTYDKENGNVNLKGLADAFVKTLVAASRFPKRPGGK